MIDASIVGYGVVGQATAEAFEIKKYYDIEGSTATLKECAQTSFIFICLPTPNQPSKGQDLSAIKEIFQVISEIRRTPVMVIRSTVLPGTAKWLAEKYRMEVVSFPEFGSEATMLNDIKYPQMIVMGSENKQSAQFLMELLYKDSVSPKILTDTVTAETIKYACNVFFALKVTYANLIYDLCQSSGADYELMRKEIFEKHPWFGKNHWEIWHKGYRGFGGRCLPKDVEAFYGYKENPLLKAVLLMNEDFRNRRKND